MRSFSLLSLPVVAVLLAVLTLVLVVVGKYWNLGLTTFALLAIPVVLAVVYLAWYRTLPYEPVHLLPSPVSPSPDADREPFEDPVEEADRLERDASEGEDEEEPTAPPPVDSEEPT